MEEIRKTDNNLFLQGILKEKKIEIKPSKKSGKLMAIGELKVIVNNELGKGVLKVSLLQMADKKDGSVNKLFKALQTISTQYKAADEVGEENADFIRIEGSLEDNVFYDVDDQEFKESVKLKAFTVNRVEDTNETQYCKVKFEGRIASVNLIEEDLEVEIIGIGYQGVAFPLKTRIPQNLVAAFQSRYPVGCTTSLNMYVINQVISKQIEENIGFGESLGEKIERTITKREVFGGGTPIFEGSPNALSTEIIQKGMAIREANKESKKQEAFEKKNSNGSSSMQSGFGNPMGNNFPNTGMQSGFASPQGVGGMPNNGFGMPNMGTN